MNATTTRRPATRRLEAGHQQIAALLNYWLARSNLSHTQLAAIAAWSQGERGWLDSAVLSRLRNSQNPRGFSIRQLLAMDAANQAIWCWQVQGEAAAVQRWGPYSSWGVRRPSMEMATWLPRPDAPDEPLVFADLAEVMVGLLQIPYLSTGNLSPSQGRKLSERLADLLNDVLAETGLKPRDAMDAMLRAYPVEQASRRSRLRDCVLGEDRWTGDELEAELLAIAEAIRVLRNLPAGSYGPAELTAELNA